ncbi:hypothetical protein SAMN05421543_10987 [Alicyclobacillus macrosporangiidus]|uniref:Uncharacterized protein n=1 Tax=Alicyclobacillus macrosporangiidus TaxID=392015 RepID=A0A1I7JBZ9_9BACL|nr:hypothetical protein SAMN05421543_10987 [Alicyclobacillus macrosporangiidus]
MTFAKLQRQGPRELPAVDTDLQKLHELPNHMIVEQFITHLPSAIKEKLAA